MKKIRAKTYPGLARPDHRLQLIVLAHLVWLAIVCLLGIWWGTLLLRQAKKIAQLENAMGWAIQITENYWNKTERMLFWELATFLALLLAATVFLFWLYWRDVKRARGIQAFFASVTHELRTPLTSIRLQAESIAETLGEDGIYKNLVHRLLEDTLRLEAQVERALELARVEGGGPVYTQSLQIKPWMDRFLMSWAGDYQDRAEFDTKVEDVLVEADPTALKVIFKNLFENSVRHSKCEKVKISILATPETKGVSLLFRDNGKGFQGDKSSLGRLFHKGPTSPGTGVGLYLVKVLMKRMGGRVTFRLESGFEVLLWLPEGRLYG